MILNVNEIVEKKIKELDESHVIETAIEKKIESVITQAVNDAFDWTFSRKISDKIREQIGDLAENIKLNSYNTLVADTVRNIIEADMSEDIAKKVQSKIKELLLVTEKTVKLSDIIEKFKSVNFDDEEEYSYSVTETDRKSFYGAFATEYLQVVNIDGISEKEKEMIINAPITPECFEKWKDYHYEEIKVEKFPHPYEKDKTCEIHLYPTSCFEGLIRDCEVIRQKYLETKNGHYLDILLHLLPNSYRMTKTN